MVQANEVRIGNKLKSHLTKEIVNVDWLVMKHLEDGNIQSVYTPDIPVYEPIPISAEILNKCGFEWDVFYQAFTNGQYVVKLLHDGKITFSYCKRKNDDFQFLPFIQYLHQLQNIHFSVTNRELEVSLK